MAGTLITLLTAIKNKLKIISEVLDEDAIDLIIDSFFARIVLWGILPTISVIISFPFYPFSLVENIVVWIGAAALFVMGGVTIFFSTKV